MLRMTTSCLLPPPARIAGRSRLSDPSILDPPHAPSRLTSSQMELERDTEQWSSPAVPCLYSRSQSQALAWVAGSPTDRIRHCSTVSLQRGCHSQYRLPSTLTVEETAL